jgi:hypothetical protein
LHTITKSENWLDCSRLHDVSFVLRTLYHDIYLVPSDLGHHCILPLVVVIADIISRWIGRRAASKHVSRHVDGE